MYHNYNKNQEGNRASASWNKASSSFQKTQRHNPYAKTPHPGNCHPRPPALEFSCICKFSMISANRFSVDNSKYCVEFVEACKKINSRSYDSNKKLWSFHIKDYKNVVEVFSSIPKISVQEIPQFVIQNMSSEEKTVKFDVLEDLDSIIQETLTQSQKEAVVFGISKTGRCLIADDMGLGKTYTAIALADFYRLQWPLLIVTTASLREMWRDKLQELLSYIGDHKIVLQSNIQESLTTAKIVITSYNLFERSSELMFEKKFGVVIFDESHQLKNPKAQVTLAAKTLCKKVKHVILLSGTPALSRPVELFTQLLLLKPDFASYKGYTERYCNGQQTHFGYNDKGQSNLIELNALLTKKFMIRRMKADVLINLSSKKRETIMLDNNMIKTSKLTQENLKSLAENFRQSTGKEKEAVLMQYYSLTAEVKKNAVCSYVKRLLKEGLKFIIFGHHLTMLNAIEECLIENNTEFIRIDGSTRSDLRNDLVTQFQNTLSCRVAVLSIQACHSGLTLTAASLVVFAELVWNPSLLHQAESRAHRMGQSSTVVCRYLLAESTADPIIWNLLKQKQNTLEKVGLCTEDFADGVMKKAETSNNDLEWEEIENEKDLLNFCSQDYMMKEKKDVTTEANSTSQAELQALLNDGDDDLFANFEF